MLQLARPAALAVLSLCLLPSSSPSPQAPVAADADAARSAFYDVLDQSARLMGAGRWDKAREALLAALAQHGAAEYVLRALPGVQEDLEQCAFWSSYKRPEPQDVVAGELLAWDPKKGDIKLRYALAKEARKELARKRRGTRQLPFESDFIDINDLFAHPLMFQGPHSIEIRCGPLGTRQPFIVVCSQEDEAYLAIASKPSGIVRLVGNSRYEEDRASNSMPTDEPMRIKVEVRDRKITLSANGKTLASCEKDKDRWGQLAFYGCPDVEEVLISGEVETAWIEGLVDATVEKARAAFAEGYDPLAALPELLREHADDSTAEEEGWFDVLPGLDASERAAELAQVGEFLGQGEWEKALLYLDSLQGEELAALRIWCRAISKLMQGKADEAELELDALAKLEPGFWPARELAASLRTDTGPRDRSLAEARQLVAELPDEPRARVLLAQAYLMSSMTDEAQATLDEAHAAGLSSAGLDKQRRVLARAVRGPEWARSFESTTAHYEVRSDISRELCYEAGQALEAMYKKLDVNFRRIDPDKKKGRRFRVFLFSGRSGYLSYAADVMDGGHEQSAGMYSSVLKQLLIWNLPERERMMTTIRHEGFHQVFDQICDHAPRWLNEGLAEYFELSRRVGGKWKDGIVHPEHVYTLEKLGFVPLAEFLTVGPQGFYANMRVSYAQGWALVHFLLESGPAQRQRFDALLDGLIAGEETNALLARVFPAKDLPELDKALRAHVEGLEE